MQTALIVGTGLPARPRFQPPSRGRSVRPISRSDFISAILNTLALATAMAITGIITGTTTDIGTMATDIIMADHRMDTGAVDTTTGPIVAIPPTHPNTDTGHPITVPPTERTGSA